MAISGVICLGLLDSTADVLTLGFGVVDLVDNPGVESWYRQGAARTSADMSLARGHARHNTPSRLASLKMPRRGYIEGPPKTAADMEDNP